MTEFFTHTVGTANYSAIFGGWTSPAYPDKQKGVWYNYIHQGLVDYSSSNFDGTVSAIAIAFALPGYRLRLAASNEVRTKRGEANAVLSTTIVRSEIYDQVDAGQLFITSS